MRLTVVQIEAQRPRNKPFRLFDGRGLYLEVSPNGSRYWRVKYRFGGKEKRLALGIYPEVGLKEARLRLDDVRRKLRNHIDPGEQRKVAKALGVSGSETSFEPIAREWFAMQSKQWTQSHADKIIGRLELHVFPWIGKREIRSLEAPDLLPVMRRIEVAGANETAHRALQACGRIFRYAIATGRGSRDVTRDLAGALAPVVENHFPTLTDPRAIGQLLNAIDGYQGTIVVRCALRLAPLVMVRNVELRKAKWPELYLDEAEWRIPQDRMKKRRIHIVPLARQAIDILRELKPATSHLEWVFPGEYDRKRAMSENAINAALRRIGYPKDEFTHHSFRSMGSTLLNEKGWNTDAIERQLAHVDGNKVRAAYNYAEHLPLRRQMMQALADYYDELRMLVRAPTTRVA